MFRVSVQRKRHRKLPNLPQGMPHVKVGLIAGKADSDVVSRGIWNEFGTKRGIPERPFMRNAMRANRGKYQTLLADQARMILRGTTTVESVLRKLGVMAKGDVQREITTLSDPPNAASTIARKGSSNPLIETGEMRRAIEWELER